MKISLELVANLKRYGGSSKKPGHLMLELPEGSRVFDIFNLLAIPSKSVALITRNNINISNDTSLTDKDKIKLYPPVGGG